MRRRSSSSATHGFRLDRVTRDPIVSLAPKDVPRTMIMRDDRSVEADFVLLLGSARQRLKGDSDRRADETNGGERLVAATDFVSSKRGMRNLGLHGNNICSFCRKIFRNRSPTSSTSVERDDYAIISRPDR